MSKLKNLSKIVIILLLISVIIFFNCQQPSSSGGGGGGGDDDSSPTPELANGVFAKLYVQRDILLNETVRADYLKAHFSKYYDPCAVESDLHPTSVSCTDSIIPKVYDLPFENNKYEYKEPLNFVGFLSLGATYTFNITASAEVPALTESINLQSVEPIIITPDNNASVSKSSDLLVTWQGTTVNTVQISLIPVNNPTINFNIEVNDTGIYTIPFSSLSPLASGSCVFRLVRFEKNLISAPGYDNRSMIIAELIDSIFINLTN